MLVAEVRWQTLGEEHKNEMKRKQNEERQCFEVACKHSGNVTHILSLRDYF
jgi:hypothetical protein